MNQSAMDKIAVILKRKFGLSYSGPNRKSILKKVMEFIHKNGYHSVDAFYEELSRKTIPEDKYKKLIDILTINETYFFRERRILEVLKQETIPNLLQNEREQITIWCAACSSGEEVYTLSILITELMQKYQIKKKVKIVGTDINVKKLDQAILGEYREWSFRNVPEAVKNQYFEKSGKNTYRILKNKIIPVDFFYLNLVNPLDYDKLKDYTPLDLVLARNVFIYFEKDVIQKVGKLIYSVLRKDGYFITSSVESNSEYFPEFKLIHYPGCIFFRKSEVKTETTVKKDLQVPDELINKKVSVRKRLKRKQDLPSRKPISKSGSIRETKKTHELIPESALKELEDLVELAQYSQAEQALELLLEKFSENDLSDEQFLRLKLIRSRIMAAQGQMDKALELLLEIEKENNLIADVHYLKGLIFLEQNQTELALQSFERAVFLEPQFFMAHYMRAILFLNDHQRNEGKRILSRMKNELAMLENDAIIRFSDGVKVAEMKSLITHLMEN